jgi:molybdopterin converting factor small subunit
MAISVKLIGALRHAAGVESLTVDYREGFTVRHLLEDIIPQTARLNRNLSDPHLKDPWLSTLILVNATETSALNGLDTALQDGDELVLIPVVHGG